MKPSFQYVQWIQCSPHFDLSIPKPGPGGGIALQSISALSERRHQRFIEESKIKDSSGLYDITDALDKCSDYMYKYRDNYKKHDITPLLSSEDWKDFAGLAWLGGACYESHYSKSSRKTQITQDQGGFWYGSYTFAHELAHNLNADHDGDVSFGRNASQCPWSEGHIMSYEGWGQPNKFRFSSCTMRQISEFLRTSDSACLKTNDVPSYWFPAIQDPGDCLNWDDQCKAQLNREDAKVNLQMNFARIVHVPISINAGREITASDTKHCTTLHSKVVLAARTMADVRMENVWGPSTIEDFLNMSLHCLVAEETLGKH
ncbi:unnamed protein product [Allacma fusca]|uniref:Peptidase M12B domain-containing protein n=1 Tax=Allacma fusca TaxID=39272 RepID=A0A8J2KT63_9HEXA|nr:unnamed protein product [Allacma fusca]